MTELGIIGGVGRNVDVGKVQGNNSNVHTYAATKPMPNDEVSFAGKKKETSTLKKIVKAALLVGGAVLGAKFLKSKGKYLANKIKTGSNELVKKFKTVLNNKIKPQLQNITAKIKNNVNVAKNKIKMQQQMKQQKAATATTAKKAEETVTRKTNEIFLEAKDKSDVDFICSQFRATTNSLLEDAAYAPKVDMRQFTRDRYHDLLAQNPKYANEIKSQLGAFMKQFID